jgi:two-component system heavy metal sensor histidine kinase CusS
VKQARPMSLTTRLGLLFALVAVLTFAGVGIYLYQALALQLEARDDADLMEKIGHIRHLLDETPSLNAIGEDPHRFLDIVAAHHGLILVLRTAEGKILWQNQPDLGALPVLPMGAVDKTPDANLVRQWMLQSGQSSRAVAVWSTVGERPQQQVAILLARSTQEQASLLHSYRHQVLLAILGGALLAALLAYGLVRRGLQPLHAIARQAQSITAQHFDLRLDASRAPQEMQTLIAAFNAMLDRLHQSFHRLSQFSADLAHDLRTPINNLMLQSQVALSQLRTADDYQALLASNLEEYERLARMLENMLFLARADHAQVALEKQVLDTTKELQRIADYFEGLADEAGVFLTVKASGTVAADPILLRRAINNLVANAIRYTPKGAAILLHAQRIGMHDIIEVSNPGAGIPAGDLPRLFDRFYRVDQARSDSASCTGLGLAIVRSIMLLHGGSAQVSSTENGMTLFRLAFPQDAGATQDFAKNA